MENVPFGEENERVVHLLAGKSAPPGKDFLADVSIIAEHTRIRAQDDAEQMLRIGIVFIDAIQFITPQG